MFKCRLIKDTSTEFDLYPSIDNFICLKTLISESHIIRYILKCRECEQLYFYEFYEEIDWVEGKDPQYSTYIPVKTIEEAEELNKISQFELLNIFPRLQLDFVGDTKTIRWAK